MGDDARARWTRPCAWTCRTPCRVSSRGGSGCASSSNITCRPSLRWGVQKLGARAPLRPTPLRGCSPQPKYASLGGGGSRSYGGKARSGRRGGLTDSSSRAGARFSSPGCAMLPNERVCAGGFETWVVGRDQFGRIAVDRSEACRGGSEVAVHEPPRGVATYPRSGRGRRYLHLHTEVCWGPWSVQRCASMDLLRAVDVGGGWMPWDGRLLWVRRGKMESGDWRGWWLPEGTEDEYLFGVVS